MYLFINLATSMRPMVDAKCNGVNLFTVFSSSFDPPAMSSSATRLCPIDAAKCSGIKPFVLALLGLAPRSSNWLTISLWPFVAASARAVQLSETFPKFISAPSSRRRLLKVNKG